MRCCLSVPGLFTAAKATRDQQPSPAGGNREMAADVRQEREVWQQKELTASEVHIAMDHPGLVLLDPQQDTRSCQSEGCRAA